MAEGLKAAWEPSEVRNPTPAQDEADSESDEAPTEEASDNPEDADFLMALEALEWIQPATKSAYIHLEGDCDIDTYRGVCRTRLSARSATLGSGAHRALVLSNMLCPRCITKLETEGDSAVATYLRVNST